MDWVNRLDTVRSDYIHVTIVHEGDRLMVLRTFKKFFGNIMKPYVINLGNSCRSIYKPNQLRNVLVLGTNGHYRAPLH